MIKILKKQNPAAFADCGILSELS